MRKTDFQERMRRTAAQYAPVLLILFLGAFLLSSMTLFGRRELATDDDARVKEAVELAPGALPGLTAEKLLREATHAYANAKYYRDDGYAEILYEREGERTTNSTRVACSLCFAKPNYVRMEFGRSLLRSDGKTIRAEILGDAFAGQIVERPAPMLLTSIREFYPDSEFAAAANLGTPPDVFWTSPQLILLFSRDPFKTLAPLNAKLKLLEPAYLRFEEDLEQEDVLCDRVEVDAGAGVRVYWFARATRALVRCELPAERLQAPVADARVVAVRVEFPRQILSQTSPCDASEFEFGADDDEVALRRVDRFEPPEVSALNQRFPLEALEGFDEGSDAVERQTTALCFWRADDDALNATFEEFAALADERPDARFYAANVDSDPAAEEFAREFFKDARVRSTRLDSSVFMRRAPDYPALVTPSLALLDASGRTLRFVCGTSDVGKLENAFGELDEGRDPRESEFNATYENARRFERFMESATTSELYRTTLETTPTLEAPPRQMTKTLRLHEVWRYDKLFSPCNPLAVSSASRTSDGQTWETRERRAQIALGRPLPRMRDLVAERRHERVEPGHGLAARHGLERLFCKGDERLGRKLARVHVAQQVGCARILPRAHEELEGALQQQILLRRLLHLTRADARFLGRLGARDLAGLQILEDVLHDLAHLLLRGLQLRARGRRLRRRGERSTGDEQQDAESGHGVSPPSPVRSPPRGGPSAS